MQQIHMKTKKAASRLIRKNAYKDDNLKYTNPYIFNFNQQIAFVKLDKKKDFLRFYLFPRIIVKKTKKECDFI